MFDNTPVVQGIYVDCASVTYLSAEKTSAVSDVSCTVTSAIDDARHLSGTEVVVTFEKVKSTLCLKKMTLM